MKNNILTLSAPYGTLKCQPQVEVGRGKAGVTFCKAAGLKTKQVSQNQKKKQTPSLRWANVKKMFDFLFNTGSNKR